MTCLRWDMRSSGPLRIKHPHLPPTETEMDACSSELSLYFFFFSLLVRYRYFSELENVLNKWASYIYVFNVICLYLFGWSQFMPSEKVKSPGNWIIPFICRHDAMQGQQKGASLSCAAPDLTPDLDVGVGALSCFPQAGVAALGGWSGAQQVPRVCGGGHCNYFHKHLLSVFWALLFPAPWRPLSQAWAFEILLRKEQHPYLHPSHTSVCKPVFTSVISSDLVNSWGWRQAGTGSHFLLCWEP